MTDAFRIAVLDDPLQVAASLADWASIDADVDFVETHLEGVELIDRLAGRHAIVAMRERTRIDADLLAALPDLRLVVTTGMRNAAIDIAAARERGVVVAGTRGGQSSTAELTWALILGLAKDVVVNDREVRAGGWQTRLGMDLAGHTLGLVGMGRLGARVGAVATAFGMELLAWSPHLTDERAAAAGARSVDKSTLFRESDIVSLHLVLSASTTGIVGAAEIAKMPPHALFVNTSRAALVDQDALRDAVEAGRIAGLAVDVYEAEPVPADSWLRTSDRVLLSPHVGHVTRDNFGLMYRDAVEDIRAFRAGERLRVLDAPGTPI